jgi:excisionase family DNA binding protein
MRARRLPIDASVGSSGRRGGVRETRAESGSPLWPEQPQIGFAIGGEGALLGTPGALASAPLLLDAKDVARELGIGRTKAYELMSRNRIPTVRIGRCVRVPSLDLAVWIATQTAGPREV